MNGNPWIPEKHNPILMAWAGKIKDAEIGTLTGHSERTIRDRRNAMGLPAYAYRPGWTRRDHLLAGAAGIIATDSVADPLTF